VAFGCTDCPPARKAARSSANSRDRGQRWHTGDLPDSRKDGRSWIALSFPSRAWISPRAVNQSATITGQHARPHGDLPSNREVTPPRLIEGARLLAVTSRVSAIVPANPNANTNSEETASRPAVVDAHNEAMVAELRAQIAQLNERVARGLGRLDALRSTDAHRIDREITPRTKQRKTLAP
jgi:hypothetical protein